MNIAQIIVCENGCVKHFTLVHKDGAEDVLMPCRLVTHHDKGEKINTYVFLHPSVAKIIMAGKTKVIIHKHDLPSVVMYVASVQYDHRDGKKNTRLIM